MEESYEDDVEYRRVKFFIDFMKSNEDAGGN